MKQAAVQKKRVLFLSARGGHAKPLEQGSPYYQWSPRMANKSCSLKGNIHPALYNQAIFSPCVHRFALNTDVFLQPENKQFGKAESVDV